MIYALGESHPTLFLMLTQADVRTMRDGRTLFVDERGLNGRDFKAIIVSLHDSNDAAMAMLQKAGPLPPPTPDQQPRVDEGRCLGCAGCIPIASMFEDRCIVCWAAEAKKLRAGFTN